MILGPHTINVVRAGSLASDYGNATELDWSNTTSTPIEGCSVQPASAVEFTIDRDTFTTRYIAYVPAGSDISPLDRIEWNGDTYDIDGDVLRWDFGALSHIVINLQRSANA